MKRQSSSFNVLSENRITKVSNESTENYSESEFINGSMKRRVKIPVIDSNRDSLIFQLIDITYREIDENLHIYLFGVTPNGNSVCCIVNGFCTYFYASFEDETEIQQCLSLEADPFVKGCEIVERYNLYCYQGEKKGRFLKITISLPSKLGYLRNKYECLDRNVKFFEDDVDPVTRFMVDAGIDGCDWIEIPPKTWRQSSAKRSFCQFDVETDYNEHQIISYKSQGDWVKIAPLRILSLDMICERSSEAEKKLQIANVIFNHGHPETIFKKVFTLKGCSEIVGVDIESFADEQSMLRALNDFIHDSDTDVISGYGIDIKSLKNISRLYNVPFREERLAEGYIILDLRKIIQKNYNLRYNTLSAARYNLFNVPKQQFDNKTIAKLFSENNETRHRLAKYGLENAIHSIKLIHELKLIEHYTEISRISGVTLNAALNQGEKIKVYNQLLRVAKRKDFILPTRFKAAGEKIQGGLVLEAKCGYYESPIAVLDFASMSSNIIITYNLCYTTLLDPEKGKDLNISDSDKWCSPENYEFVKANIRKGLLPEILENLLNLRDAIKKAINVEKDPVLKKMLESRQSAVKLLANAIYGYTGIKWGQILSCFPVVKSITAYGRKILSDTAKEIELMEDAKIIYGDTDSVMVSFGVETVQECINLAQKAIQHVSSLCPGTITLKYENVYLPYLLLAKKQYCGVKYVQAGHEGEIVMKGIKAISRDCLPLAAHAIKTCLQKVLMEKDNDGAVEYARKIISDLLCNRIDISQFVISKELTKTDNAAKQAHIEVSHKMKKRDPGNAPFLGDQVAFVICSSAKNKAPLYMKAEDPIYALENCVPIDSNYYLKNQLTKPLLQIFKPILGDKVESILLSTGGDQTRTRTVVTSKVGALAAFTKKKETCLGCKALLPNGYEKNALCPHCEPQRSGLYQQELTAQRTLEESFSRLWTECQRCQGSLHEEVLCTNRSCPIFYMRKKNQIELDMQQKSVVRFDVPSW